MRWTKGQSGNPAGRPRKGRSLNSALEGVVDKKQLAEIIWREARKGSQWAISLIYSRLEPIESSLRLKHEAVRDEPVKRFDYSRLSNEDLAQLERIFQRATVGPGAIESGAVQAEPALLPGASMADY